MVLTTRHFGIRILTQVSVQDGITDLVADLIWKIRFKSSLWSYLRIPSEYSWISAHLSISVHHCEILKQLRWVTDVRVVLALTGMTLTHRLRSEHEGVLTGSVLVDAICGVVHVSALPV